MAERDRAARGAQRAAARGDHEGGEAAAGGPRVAAAGGGLGPDGAAAGGGRPALGAGAGVGHRGGAPHPHGPADRALGDGNKQTWLGGNKNKEVKEPKIGLTTSPFKSENTPTKLKNKRLMDVIELKYLKNLVSDQGTTEISEESLKRYKELLQEYEHVKEEIRSAHGMAIPMPKDVEKLPKCKVSLFK